MPLTIRVEVSVNILHQPAGKTYQLVSDVLLAVHRAIRIGDLRLESCASFRDDFDFGSNTIEAKIFYFGEGVSESIDRAILRSVRLVIHDYLFVGQEGIVQSLQPDLER